MQLGLLMPPRYKIILKTTHKHKNRVANCLNTWLATLDYICLTDKPTGRFNEISGCDDDSYNSNEQKTITLINLIRTTNLFNEYDWLVFIDDDAILNTKRFESILPYMDKSFVYGFNMKGVYKKDLSLSYPSGGCSYFISPSLIKSSQFPMKNQRCGFEDVSLGYWMRENNIPITDEYIKDDKSHPLNLNGWFPFQSWWDRLIVGKDRIAKQMVASFGQKEEDIISRSLTHHYIRYQPLMEYIHNVMKKAP